jgi:hypothetical protein
MSAEYRWGKIFYAGNQFKAIVGPSRLLPKSTELPRQESSPACAGMEKPVSIHHQRTNGPAKPLHTSRQRRIFNIADLRHFAEADGRKESGRRPKQISIPRLSPAPGSAVPYGAPAETAAELHRHHLSGFAAMHQAKQAYRHTRQGPTPKRFRLGHHPRVTDARSEAGEHQHVCI